MYFRISPLHHELLSIRLRLYCIENVRAWVRGRSMVFNYNAGRHFDARGLQSALGSEKSYITPPISIQARPGSRGVKSQDQPAICSSWMFMRQPGQSRCEHFRNRHHIIHLEWCFISIPSWGLKTHIRFKWRGHEAYWMLDGRGEGVTEPRGLQRRSRAIQWRSRETWEQGFSTDSDGDRLIAADTRGLQVLKWRRLILV